MRPKVLRLRNWKSHQKHQCQNRHCCCCSRKGQQEKKGKRQEGEGTLNPLPQPSSLPCLLPSNDGVTTPECKEVSFHNTPSDQSTTHAPLSLTTPTLRPLTSAIIRGLCAPVHNSSMILSTCIIIAEGVAFLVILGISHSLLPHRHFSLFSRVDKGLCHTRTISPMGVASYHSALCHFINHF